MANSTVFSNSNALDTFETALTESLSYSEDMMNEYTKNVTDVQKTAETDARNIQNNVNAANPNAAQPTARPSAVESFISDIVVNLFAQ